MAISTLEIMNTQRIVGRSLESNTGLWITNPKCLPYGYKLYIDCETSFNNLESRSMTASYVPTG